MKSIQYAICFLVMTLSASLSAALIASESFSTGSVAGYKTENLGAPGNASNITGTFGFTPSQPWNGNTLIFMTKGDRGLKHIAVAGSSAAGVARIRTDSWNSADHSPRSYNMYRVINTPVSGSVFYMSGLIKMGNLLNLNEGSSVAMGLIGGGLSNRISWNTKRGVHFGMTKDLSGNAYPAVFAGGNAYPIGNALTFTQALETQMVVVRLDVADGNDSLKAWVLGRGETNLTNAAQLDVSDMDIGSITDLGWFALQSQGGSNNNLSSGIKLDEFRFGTTLADVTTASFGPQVTMDNAPVVGQVAAVTAPNAIIPGSVASRRWHQWRTSRKEFPLMAWSYFSRYSGSTQEYQVYKDAGLNMVQAPAPQMEHACEAGLDLMVGAFRDVHEDMDELAEMVDFANTHSGKVTVYSLKDEPIPEDLPVLAHAVDYIYSHDTAGALPIIDFRPDWAVPDRWGISYETFCRRFVKEVHPPVMLNCHYPIKRDGTTRSSYYSNIEYFRHLALQNDIGLMGFILVTAHTFENNREIDYRAPSESDLNWMVNTYLAYGAQGLWYYNWRIEDLRFSEGLVDGPTGEPTALYPMVQQVNGRVKALGRTLMKLKSQMVLHTDEVVPEGTTRYAPGMIQGIYDFNGKSFIVSQFYNQDDPADKAVYLMIVNKLHAANTASDQLKQTASFSVYPDYKTISSFDTEKMKFRKLELPTNSVTLEIGGGQAAVLILSP